MIHPYTSTFSLRDFCLPIEVTLVLFISCFEVSAQQPTPNPVLTNASTPTNSPTVPDDARYRIGPGDVPDIRIYNRPTLSRDGVRVEGNGKFRMPLIETEIQAACKTEGE